MVGKPKSLVRALCAAILMIGACSCESVHRVPRLWIGEWTAAGPKGQWVGLASGTWRLPPEGRGEYALRLAGLKDVVDEVRWYRYIDGQALAPINGIFDAKDQISAEKSISDNKRKRSSAWARDEIWVEMHIAGTAKAGEYVGMWEFLKGGRVVAEAPEKVRIYNFSLPEHPRLALIGKMDTASLRRLYGGNLPDSLNWLIQTCNEHRLQLSFAGLSAPGSAPVAKGDIHVLGPSAYLDGVHALEFLSVRSWFYPGEKFGLDYPVQTVVLNDLRQAEEDYEYLTMAANKGYGDIARSIAQLLVRPAKGKIDSMDRVLVRPADLTECREGRKLLVQLIEAGKKSEEAKLSAIRWIAQHSGPSMLIQSPVWSWDQEHPGTLDLKVTVDLFNPSEISPQHNTLRWESLSEGWSAGPATEIADLPSSRITHATIGAKFDADRLMWEPSGWLRVMFISGFDGSQRDVGIRLPVAHCDRREGAPTIDGSLTDWSTDDTIFSGRLIRPEYHPIVAIDRGNFYASFSDQDLFLAFRFRGANECTVMIQPLYADNSLGKVSWIDFAKIMKGCKGKYAATSEGPFWRGEAAIPWSQIVGKNGKIPSALRFNFDEDGMASWAGPMGWNREGKICGVLVLRNSPDELVK